MLWSKVSDPVGIAKAKLELAKLYVMAGLSSEALPLSEAGRGAIDNVKADAEFDDLVLALAEAYYLKDDFPTAESILAKSRGIERENQYESVKAIELYAKLLFMAGRAEEAQKYYARLRELKGHK